MSERRRAHVRRRGRGRTGSHRLGAAALMLLAALASATASASRLPVTAPGVQVSRHAGPGADCPPPTTNEDVHFAPTEFFADDPDRPDLEARLALRDPDRTAEAVTLELRNGSINAVSFSQVGSSLRASFAHADVASLVAGEPVPSEVSLLLRVDLDRGRDQGRGSLCLR